MSGLRIDRAQAITRGSAKQVFGDAVGDGFEQIDMAFPFQREDAVADHVVIDDRLVGGARRW